ncbi:MAG: methyltransferase [Proteobacteria bacterium]|nr:methyltransferase [Pseudomonadota bacterium]
MPRLQITNNNMGNKDKTKGQFTRDTVYAGRLVLEQPRKGYRFSIDALLLTWFACQGRHAALTADLGAGCGVVGLGLLAAGHTRRVIAVEVQPSLAELAVRNAQLNDLESSYQVVVSDVNQPREAVHQGAFDLIVTNPPFWPAPSGRLPEDGERRIACHEILGSIDNWVDVASNLLDPRRGRVVIVFPARRLDSLIIALDRAKLSGTRLCLVHPHADKPAELALIEARAGKPDRLAIAPPLTLKDPDGTDTKEATLLINGEFSEALKERQDRRT